MSNFKNTTSSLNPEFYLKHKNYFDSRLIESLEKSEERNYKLSEQNKAYASLIKKYKVDKIDLEFKNHDLAIRYSNVCLQMKEKEEDMIKIIKGFEKEIEEQGAIIHNELDIAYKDNIKLHDENNRLKDEIAKLRRESEKYRKTRKMDSTNSSTPPSKDEFKTVSNSREKSTRNRGGQVGHNLHHSKISSNPNKVVYKIVVKAPTGAVAVLSENKEVAIM